MLEFIIIVIFLNIYFIYAIITIAVFVLGIIASIKLTRRMGFNFLYFITPLFILNIGRKYNFYKITFIYCFIKLITDIVYLNYNLNIINESSGNYIIDFLLLMMLIFPFMCYYTIALLINLYKISNKNGKKVSKFKFIVCHIFGVLYFYLSFKSFNKSEIVVSQKRLAFDKIFSIICGVLSLIVRVY